MFLAARGELDVSPDAVGNHRIGRAQFSAVCQAAGVPNPHDTAELHNRTLALSVRCKRRKDTDELENVISGYKPKETAVQPAAPVQQQPATAPWARK